ncbi:glucans biosynthesis glucosyltransferase MdoH [Roseibium sp.]|uniref:glucans biosynthesis glucosyltransferase MdoH n=1 Tax=Roseibium sp. TaxID=1936156 RepID=UPI003A96E938
MRDAAKLNPSQLNSFQMTVRRVLFWTLVAVSFLGLAVLMGATLAPGEFGALKSIMFVCFLVTLPWTIIGFWNAVIGLVVMRFSQDPVAKVCPIDKGDASIGLTSKTAILPCVRDEDTRALERKLSSMLEGLARSGEASAFSLFVLSDTSNAEIAAKEKTMAARLAARWGGQIPVTYRRRSSNDGFKAGNIQAFCDHWGSQYDFALVLDADSYMSMDAILDLVRRMEANPQVGILQSLVVGLPAHSAFARIFQFGMRLGMRSYTIGSAWWQGDCGPYWGHNALLRLEPFMAHCRLPELPGKGPLGGSILSHDQVEAVLMRRAGYEVRVLPQEGGSYEENPPHLLEFIRRDLRWCQGNLQYLKLLTMKGIRPVSRMQLVLAILMFLGSPAWIGFMVSAALAGLAQGGTPLFHADTGYALFIIIMVMVFAPKLATMLDVLIRKNLRSAFGGPLRVLASTLVEIVYSAMLAPVMAVAHSLFIGGLLFGKTIGWGAQGRDVEKLPLLLTASKLWPQTAFGLFATAWIASQPLSMVWPVIPIAIGPLLSIPFAVMTSSPALGLGLVRSTLWRIPEESIPPSELRPLYLPALRRRRLLSGLNKPVGEMPLPAQTAPVRVKA